jgi:hypothetical protein
MNSTSDYSHTVEMWSDHLGSQARLCCPLDGEWQLAFDPENVGKEKGWQTAFPASLEVAQVPAVWELVRPDYDGVGWYRRTFDRPANWDGKSILLQFDAAQYFAEVWLNGEYLGSHEGGFLRFEFEVSRLLKARENEVVVRVIGPPMNEEIEGFRCGAPLNQGPIPTGKAGWYFNFGGLWQSVRLLATGPVKVQRIFPQPQLSPDQVTIGFDLKLFRDSAARTIRCDVLDPDGAVVASESREVVVKSGDGPLSFAFSLPGARRWTLEDPALYTASVTVADGEILDDTFSVRFGMREFTVKDGFFTLNGERVVLKGFLHQGAFPRTIVRAESRAFAENELRAVKEGGFNFVRAHMGPPLHEWLDLCDEMGILVMCEPPIGWIEHTALAESRCWREIEGLVKRVSYHPSVVFWGLMNEVFHLLGFTPEVVIEMTTRWMKDVRALDPTRPIIDVSGGHGLLPAGGAADMLPDTANLGLTAIMSVPGEEKTRFVVDAHVYHNFPVREATLKHFRTMGNGDQLFFMSEYGAPPVPPHFDEVMAQYSEAEKELGLEDYRLHLDFSNSLEEAFGYEAPRLACGDSRQFIETCNALRAEELYHLTMGLRSNPKMAGYCFCQLADASGELFGALDFFRRPKPTMAALGEGSDEGALGVFATPRVSTPGAPIEIEVVLPGREGALAPTYEGEWSVTLVDAAGAVKEKWQGEISAKVGRAPVCLLETKYTEALPIGRWKLEAKGRLNGVVLHGRYEFSVLPLPSGLEGEVAINGVGSPLGLELAKLGLKRHPFGNNFRGAQMPIVMDLSKVPTSRQVWFEELGQLRKIMHVGGCALVLNPEMALVKEVIPEAAVRMQPMLRAVGYTIPSPIFEHLSPGGLLDYPWAENLPAKHDRVDDVIALGGEILAGGLSFNMWTRPADFDHGAAIYRLPVGQGSMIVCHHPLLAGKTDAGEWSPAGLLLLKGLIRYAQGLINVRDTTPLLSRCIDWVE